MKKKIKNEGVKKKPIWKRWWFWVIAVIVFFVILGSIGGSKNESKESGQNNSSSKSTQQPTVQTVGMNENLQVGEVKWTAIDVQKKDSISDNSGYYSKAASGVFVVVQLTAELTGKESGIIDSNQIKLIDSQSRTFSSSTDGQTAIEMSGQESLFLKQVNPNVPVTGYAVFDVAKDATGLKLEIKDLRLLSSDKGYINLGI